jgi:two-component system, OmpR family, sensor histidine kinase VicK
VVSSSSPATVANNGDSIEKMEVLRGVEDTAKRILHVFSSIKNSWDVCADYTGPSVTMGVEQLKKEYLNFKDKGVRTRYITEVTKDNIPYCKEMMKFVTELRHLDGVKGNFGIGDRAVYMAVATMQEAKPVSQLIYSNSKQIIEQHQYLFETLWNKATPAQQKIIEIEEGVKPDVIEVIQSAVRAKDLYLDLVKSSNEEVMLIFPTISAFIRQEKIGVIQLSQEAAKERNVKVRILMPGRNSTKYTEASEQQQSDQTVTAGEEKQKQYQQQLQKTKQKQSNIDIRYIEQTSGTKATILVVDKKHSLVMELKDDSKTSFDEAIGFSTYSNSRPGVLSYVSIFESLWIQTEIYQQVKETRDSLAKSNNQLALANEQLKIHDRMQKQFINIAAHELKTPTQGILGFSNLLKRYPEKRQELIEAICRNATRLQRLISDILDVTKIESQNLKLQKEQLNLSNLLIDIVNDYKSQIGKSDTTNKPNVNLLLLYEKPSEDNMNQIFVEADKTRLTQVISNLLNNAIKFTKEGTISIVTKRSGNSYEAVVSIKDTGTGIHPEIMPRLFEKFASKSYQGTGLGLFISRAIVEAHGGRIWAENNNSNNNFDDSNGNNNKKGAIFTFTLPLSK